jgi:hypothetical protein
VATLRESIRKYKTYNFFEESDWQLQKNVYIY